MINRFMVVATDELFQYLHRDTFKNEIIAGTDAEFRIHITGELRSRIDRAIHTWQLENIAGIFQKTIVEKYKDILRPIRINEDLSIDTMQRKEPAYGFNKTIGPSIAGSLIGTSGSAVLSGLAMSRFLLNPILGIGITAAGAAGSLLVTGIRLASEDFDEIRDRTFNAEVDAISKEMIQETFHKRYEQKIKTLILTQLKATVVDLEADEKMCKCHLVRDNRVLKTLATLITEISNKKNFVKHFENFENR